jgi:hypothetical protein
MTFRTSLLALAAIVVALAQASADPKPAPPPTPPPAGQAPAPPKAKDVEAGPIFDQAEAEQKCPTVCKPPTKWNGRWHTTQAQMMSVCACVEPAPPPPPPPPPPAVKTAELEAGPLFDQKAADAKCPQVCKAPATWTGAWRTTKRGVMSVCTCQEPLVKTVETSSIKSSADAKTKCTKACAPQQWNGDWKKQSKKKATCDCVDLPPPPPPIAPPPPVAPKK